MFKLFMALMLFSQLAVAGEITVRKSNEPSKVFENKVAKAKAQAQLQRQRQLQELKLIRPFVARCFSQPLTTGCGDICIDGICPELDDYLDTIVEPMADE